RHSQARGSRWCTIVHLGSTMAPSAREARVDSTRKPGAPSHYSRFGTLALSDH
ncbi:unnamed protein product, partial [Ectocarpus sp. 12 AP-2014]